MCVRLHSIETIVRLRCDHGKHLSLHPGKRRAAKHQGAIEPHGSFHDTRVEAHDMDDMPYAARSIDRSVELLLEQAPGFRHGDLFYKRHRFTGSVIPDQLNVLPR